ncbi:hypothetical protein P700755_000582 [Psychroflexus torquis ATCC 700755]|uniref:Uncharacterized protein n=1 Tax=Psychroflexus torquis (strain ATCC 700755 / CIP 106069 / ACAM 623) TaxID=313595 RepID=K4ICK1_PSYTT|nr:hypothetical protein P700755_000582 [Psychroflexus torquis ATCC 700755]
MQVFSVLTKGKYVNKFSNKKIGFGLKFSFFLPIINEMLKDKF